MSQILSWVFFFARKTILYSKMQDRYDATMDKSINISSMKYNFKNLRYTFFKVRQIETQCSKRNVDLKQQKPRSKLTKKYFFKDI